MIFVAQGLIVTILQLFRLAIGKSLPFSRCFRQIFLGNDVVAIKNASGLMTGDRHGRALRYPRSDHVADAVAPQIVKRGAPVCRWSCRLFHMSAGSPSSSS